MSDKFLFTDVQLSVHQKDSIFGSRTLLPGQYVPFTDLPDYVQEAVTRGDVKGARVVTEAEAELLAERYAPDEPGEEETSETGTQYVPGLEQQYNQPEVESGEVTE